MHTLDSEPTLESRYLYRGRILNLRVDTVELPKGGKTKREIVEHGHSVVVVPVDKGGTVLLVSQFRKATESYLLEAPAGGVEEGESPEECALRELKEETGYTAGTIKHLGSFWIAPGFCTEYMHAYLATDLEPGETDQKADENIELARVPLAEVPQRIRSGELRDSKSIAALLMSLFLFPDASDAIRSEPEA
ncbi:MAG: NUDIX hydrolase [Chloroflexi bacterium]|nr:NUDIX hydrolase [Chloroflexota bacterium]